MRCQVSAGMRDRALFLLALQSKGASYTRFLSFFFFSRILERDTRRKDKQSGATYGDSELPGVFICGNALSPPINITCFTQMACPVLSLAPSLRALWGDILMSVKGQSQDSNQDLYLPETVLEALGN